MSLEHGISTVKKSVQFVETQNITVGIPFYVGAWPCHAGTGYTGMPQLARNFEAAKNIGGYSSEWRDADGKPKWSLCQAMYAQFKVFKLEPAIFMNVYNPKKHTVAVEAKEYTVSNHAVKLSIDAIIDDGFKVKNGETELVRDTDYTVFYGDDNCIVELLSKGSAYAATALNIEYNAANPAAITAEDIEAAVELVERCMGTVGIVPDMLCCPGWSQTPAVAAVMAAKAANINGIFKGKAMVDIDTDKNTGATSYSAVKKWKTDNGYTDENMIVTWPFVTIDKYRFDYSVFMCGVIGDVWLQNDGYPSVSPSNEKIDITGTCLKDGTEVNLSIGEANTVSNAGIVTALNFDGWRTWGNYTGCWPEINDVSKHFISCNCMHDFICNIFVKMFFDELDENMSPVLIDMIVNDFNSYLGGLVSANKLVHGEVAYISDNNDTENLLAGKFRIDTSVSSAVPAQMVENYTEFDVAALVEAMSTM